MGDQWSLTMLELYRDSLIENLINLALNLVESLNLRLFRMIRDFIVNRDRKWETFYYFPNEKFWEISWEILILARKISQNWKCVLFFAIFKEVLRQNTVPALPNRDKIRFFRNPNFTLYFSSESPRPYWSHFKYVSQSWKILRNFEKF